jgi:methyl-accepting chemotaxis protein
VLHGNFQLGLLLALAIVLALGILMAAGLNYFALEMILEQAAFSAHLSTASSGELVWRAILEVACLSAGTILFIGCAALMAAMWYLERLFSALSTGLERLASGECAYRIQAKRIWLGGSLLSAFNDAADSIEQRSNTMRALLEMCIATASANRAQQLHELRALQRQLRF